MTSREQAVIDASSRPHSDAFKRACAALAIERDRAVAFVPDPRVDAAMDLHRARTWGKPRSVLRRLEEDLASASGKSKGTGRARRIANEHVVTRAGRYGHEVEKPRARSADETRRLLEEYEMERMLQGAHYKTPGRYARILAAEGVGPEELRERMRVSPKEAGSLLHTHRFERW